jgi:hypothetical protein
MPTADSRWVFKSKLARPQVLLFHLHPRPAPTRQNANRADLTRFGRQVKWGEAKRKRKVIKIRVPKAVL